MDFVSYIRNQNEKLTSSDYVFHLWHELEEHNNESEINPQSASDYNNHLPLDVEDFWISALEKINESPSLQEIDENLKIYLLTLIYHCITQSHDSISDKCVVSCSEVYLQLLSSRWSVDFYKSKLYRGTLNTLQSLTENAKSESLIGNLVHKLGLFLKKGLSKGADLEVTLATLIQVVFSTSRDECTNFDDLSKEAPAAHLALTSVKNLLICETVPSRKFIIITYLFNGLRKHNCTTYSFSIIQKSFRNLIKNLHPKFKEDHYRTFLNAFIHVWKHPDFLYYMEAVTIMNSLKEKHYRTLMDALNKMMMMKTPDKNLFKLSLAIICCPPQHSPVEKITVTNHILLLNILMHCKSPKYEISSTAIESLAEILMSTDMHKDCVKNSVKLLFNLSTEQSVTVPMMLKGFDKCLQNKKCSRTKNKHIFIIVLSIMLFSDKDYPEMYTKILEILTEAATPFDFKPFLPLLFDAYVKLTHRDYKYSALHILKIIFKLALHPMATSNEFVKNLYQAMTSTYVFKSGGSKNIFIPSIVSGEFNFKEFFQKCHTLGLIKDEHIKLLKNLPSLNESDLKFLCAIIHLTEFKDLAVIATYINDNIMTISSHDNLNYIFYVYNSILKNRKSVVCSNNDLKSNEIMLHFIKQNLLKQSFRWNCVANAFSLLISFAEFTNLEEDFSRLKEAYDAQLTLTLEKKDTFLPIFYYSQLVIFGKLVPSEQNLTTMNNYLNSCSDNLYRRSPEFNSQIWLACLLLYTNICTVKTNTTEKCLDYLQNAMYSGITSIKLASINMYFDLCNMITHSFEDLINYMFKQLVYGDVNLKKTCLLKIDRLIRDDYLKLELDQFIIFVSILGDRNLTISNYLKQILSENFFLSNATIIGRYFVPLIVHINGYKKHPIYQISDDVHEVIEIVSKNISSRRKIYTLLLDNLPVKLRFNIVSAMSTNILGKMLNGGIKHDEGFWDMIKDCIFIYKLMTLNTNVELGGDNFYKKVSSHIMKFIVDNKADYKEERLYSEFCKEITEATITLLKLLFFNESDNVQRHLKIPLFDAIMHWTNFLLADLVYIVRVERCKEMQNCYVKLDAFFKKNGDLVLYTEESAKSAGDISMPNNSTGTLFNVSETYIPSFEDT